MIAWKQQCGEWILSGMLKDALPIDFARKQVISAVGGGGKTSALYRLAGELNSSGKKVVVTTTTHMLMPQRDSDLLSDIRSIEKKWFSNQIAVAGLPAGNGKMTGVSRNLFMEICGLSDVVLVEADGSRQLPVKMPAPHEPSIPENTTCVLVLGGMNALGRNLVDVCHRPELVMQLLSAEADHSMTPEDIALILNKGYWIPHVEGAGLAGTVILNQADDAARLSAAEKIAAVLYPVPCVITCLKGEETKV